MNATKQSGYSLIEVIVGVGVFSILAAGIAASTSFISRTASSNIYSNTAYTVAQGYAEQIKSIQYSTIESALNNPGSNNIPTVSLSKGSGTVSQLSDPLTFGARIKKEIIVDIEELDDGTERDRVMNMWFTVTGNNLSTSADALDAIEITIAFEWEVTNRASTQTYDGVIKLLKTAVTEF